VKEKLLSENWFSDEKEATTWVMMGKVLADEQLIYSINEKIPVTSTIRVKNYYKKTYVNKGGLKLEHALKKFAVPVESKIILDCGASTGGFTDCWLQNSAALVYAVDAGYGQLAGKLAVNPNVRNMEKTNLSDKCLQELQPKPDYISLDLSYLSLKKALPICKDILKEKGLMICLVKPIYEVDSSEIRRDGNINQRDILKEILTDLCEFYLNNAVNILGVTNSPITGNSGTLEYFIGIYWNNDDLPNINSSYEMAIEEALDASFSLNKFSKT
jgi:23S rRNA (cytidine1920-2'-O)/16S rRNA (cytidine1409-2'-O)-methyltransferase